MVLMQPFPSSNFSIRDFGYVQLAKRFEESGLVRIFLDRTGHLVGTLSSPGKKSKILRIFPSQRVDPSQLLSIKKLLEPSHSWLKCDGSSYLFVFPKLVGGMEDGGNGVQRATAVTREQVVGFTDILKRGIEEGAPVAVTTDMLRCLYCEDPNWMPADYLKAYLMALVEAFENEIVESVQEMRGEPHHKIKLGPPNLGEPDAQKQGLAAGISREFDAVLATTLDYEMTVRLKEQFFEVFLADERVIDAGAEGLEFRKNAMKILDLIKEHAIFIGKNNDNFVRIMRWHCGAMRDFHLFPLVNQFLGALPCSERLTEQNEKLAIAYSTSGGAHKSIALTVEEKLSKLGFAGDNLKVINENELYSDDPLKRTVGISHAECYNQFEQKRRCPDYKSLLRRLGKNLSFYIENKRRSQLNKAVDGASYFLSTSHHDYHVSVLNDSDRITKLFFQICDFGPISDKISHVAEKVIRYQIENITFFAPSDSTSLMVGNERYQIKRSGRSKPFPRGVVLNRGFPVKSSFVSILPWRAGAKRIVLMMGMQGVRDLLKLYLYKLKDFYRHKKNKVDVHVLCGNNSDLREELKKIFKDNLQIDGKLFITFNGIIENSLIAHVGRECHLFISKPGGATVAEALYGGFPLLLHVEEKTGEWEVKNAEEAKKRLKYDCVTNSDNVGGKIEEAIKHYNLTFDISLNYPKLDVAEELMNNIKRDTENSRVR